MKAKGVPFANYDLDGFLETHKDTKVYFDLFGCLFHFIRKNLFNGNMDGLVGYLVKLLKVSLLYQLTHQDKGNVTVVFEGKRSSEKLATAVKRLAVNERHLAKWTKAVQDPLSPVSRSRRRYLNRLAFNCWRIPGNAIDDLKARLEGKGIKCVKARFEADVYIAKQDGAVVISADGDFYFHSKIVVFGRFLKRGTRIQAFNKAAIREKLSVSPVHLLVLAILSGNDYADNITNIGINRVFKYIKTNKRVMANRITTSWVDTFVQEYNIQVDEFANAIKVFQKLEESPVLGSSGLNTRIGRFVQAYEQVKATMKALLAPTKKRKGKKKNYLIYLDKKKVAATGASASGKKNSTDYAELPDKDTTLSKSAKNAKHTPYTSAIKKCNRFQIETWQIGTLKAKLRGTDGRLSKFNEMVIEAIEETTANMNKLTAHAQRAFHYLVDYIMDETYASDYSQEYQLGEDREKIKRPMEFGMDAKKLFQSALSETKGEGGLSFWTGLLNYLNGSGQTCSYRLKVS